MRAASQAHEVVGVRVRVAGQLVAVARQLGEQPPAFAVVVQILADDEERGAHAVAREQLGEARQAAPQHGGARGLGRRAGERVNPVVAGDGVQIDGHADQARRN